jgi:ribosomal protein S18 acetylase RimI-like enzyme
METVRKERPQIRGAWRDELPEVLEVIKSAFKKEAERYGMFTIRPLRLKVTDLEKDFSEGTIVVAVLDDRIVGSATARLDEESGTCHIGHVVVLSDYRRRGIGRSLVGAAEAVYGEALRYELFTAHQSHDNIALYESLGYSIFKKAELAKTEPLMVFMEKKAARN